MTAGRMNIEWEQVIVDSADPVSLGSWWARLLGWVVVDETHNEYEIRPSPEKLPGLLFVRARRARW